MIDNQVAAIFKLKQDFNKNKEKISQYIKYAENWQVASVICSYTAMACDILLIIAMIVFLLKYRKTMQVMLTAFLQMNTKNTGIQSVQADLIGRTYPPSTKECYPKVLPHMAVSSGRILIHYPTVRAEGDLLPLVCIIEGIYSIQQVSYIFKGTQRNFTLCVSCHGMFHAMYCFEIMLFNFIIPKAIEIGGKSKIIKNNRFLHTFSHSNFCFADILFVIEHERIHFAPQTNKFSYALGSRLILPGTFLLQLFFQHMAFW